MRKLFCKNLKLKVNDNQCTFANCSLNSSSNQPSRGKMFKDLNIASLYTFPPLHHQYFTPLHHRTINTLRRCHSPCYSFRLSIYFYLKTSESARRTTFRVSEGPRFIFPAEPLLLFLISRSLTMEYFLEIPNFGFFLELFVSNV